MTALMLLAALLLDAVLGEPRWLWSRVPHPAVGMGRVIGWADARLNAGSARRAKGVVVIVILAVLGFALGLAIAALPLGALWQVLGAAILLAQRSLSDHVRAVATALGHGLPEGRRAVAMIVGRDTSAMDEPAIARAAIESGAENLSDGVIAPAFWFLIGGLPGIICYKIVNTADSMIGHRTPRHEDFGWAAARLDDLLNWVPARLTAGLLALSYANAAAWTAARTQGPRHRSPNAGWPEAAMATILGVSISGPRRYDGRIEDHPFVNPKGRAPGAADIARADAALWRVWAAVFSLCLVMTVAM